MEYTKMEWKEMLNRRHELELKNVGNNLSLAELFELGTLDTNITEGWVEK